MITRYYMDNIDSYLQPGKVLVIYGPRRVGKTTLVETYLQNTNYKYRLETGDDIRFRELLQSESVLKIQEYAEGVDLIVIDEAQRIPNVGLGLKIIVDHVPGIRVIATGSASFDLANKVGEPLTGRKVTRTLYPVAQMELIQDFSRYELQEKLLNYLLYGCYPEVVMTSNVNDKKEILFEITGSYLFKDILELERIKNSRLLLDLLRLLAFQIGKDISLSELASQLGIDYKTVGRYLDLLEKTFVIKSLSGFSRNLRKEIRKNKRYYFVDNGIRNALIANFNAVNLRDDIGALWENFVVMERLKRNEYLRQFANHYYWRTYDQKEIDLIEEKDGALSGYEFKWRKRKSRPQRAFVTAYPNSTFDIINRENYLEFVL